jgi:hypothetical protein
LVEELRIGVLEGPEEYVFGRVQGLAVDPSGAIWVADGLLNAIRRYETDGTHLGDLGGEGDGPGEFRDLYSIKALPDGRIAAYDELTHLVSFYDSTGEYLDRVRVPKFFVGGSGDMFQVDTAGHMYVTEMDRQKSGTPYIYLRLSTDGEVLDTLRRPPRGYVGAMVSQLYALGPMPAFGTWTNHHISPMGYLVVGQNEEYTLFRPLADGRTLRIERSWDPIRVKRQERVAYQTLEDHFSTRRPRNYPSTRVSSQKPPFWEFWVDDENRIWVARHGEGTHIPETPAERDRRARYGNPPNEWWEPLRFDVIEPNGRFLGLVHFPNRHTKPMVSRGNRVWVLEKGEWDEEYVVRYRIEPG